MSQTDLNRVRGDLAVVRDALGLPPPAGKAPLWANLGLALAGAILLIVAGVTDVASPPPAPGTARHWAYVGLVLLPVVAVILVLAWRARSTDENTPLVRRTATHALIAAMVAAPLVACYFAWTVHRGWSAGTITATIVFCAGLFGLVAALTNPRHLHAIPWAVATLLFGSWLPTGSYGTVGMAAGIWLVAGGLATAAFLTWQLRTKERA